jgi:hypothetical protein
MEYTGSGTNALTCHIFLEVVQDLSPNHPMPFNFLYVFVLRKSGSAISLLRHL